MLEACKKYNSEVIIGSDAHFDLDVGNHIFSWEVLAENNFPEELVINSDTKRFYDYVEYRKSLAP